MAQKPKKNVLIFEDKEFTSFTDLAKHLRVQRPGENSKRILDRRGISYEEKPQK